MFSSKCCCFELLNTPVRVEGESNGFEKSVEGVAEEALDELVVIDATAAAALLSCNKDCDNKAKSTVEGRGKEVGVDFWVGPPEKLAFVQETSAISSNLLFLDLWLGPLLRVCPISEPALFPNAIPKNDGGSNESESSGFCSL